MKLLLKLLRRLEQREEDKQQRKYYKELFSKPKSEWTWIERMWIPTIFKPQKSFLTQIKEMSSEERAIKYNCDTHAWEE